MTVAGADLPTPFAVAVVSLLVGVAAAGCANTVPTAPDSANDGLSSGMSAPGSIQLGESSVFSRSAAQPSTSFGLVSGTFSITTASGDQLTGTYTGQAEVPASRPATASLDLRVVGGSGIFEGASGALRGRGTGAFTGEDAFSLSLKGSLSLAARPGAFSFQTDIVGTARVECVDEQISITLQGDGISKRFGRMTAVLSHQVTNAGCSP